MSASNTLYERPDWVQHMVAMGDAAGGAGGGRDRTPVGNAQGGNGNRAVLFGAAVNVEYHRKFEFDMRGASMIKTSMISVPAPAPFLEAIRESARNGGSVSAGDDGDQG